MTDAPLHEVRRAVYRPVREGNALEDTVARLVQTIRLGVVAPGESLPPERELAARYAVSRDTVREAIRELADTGFLVRRRGRYGGTFVADPLPRPADPGVGAARRARGRARAAARARGGRRPRRRRPHPHARGARRALGAPRGRAAAAGETDYRRLDTLLHLTIAEVAGIPSLVALVAENRARVNAWLDTFPLLPRNIEHSNEQHEQIVTAILAGRADAAEAAIARTPRRVGGPAARLPRLSPSRPDCRRQGRYAGGMAGKKRSKKQEPPEFRNVALGDALQTQDMAAVAFALRHGPTVVPLMKAGARDNPLDTGEIWTYRDPKTGDIALLLFSDAAHKPASSAAGRRAAVAGRAARVPRRVRRRDHDRVPRHRRTRTRCRRHRRDHPRARRLTVGG